MLTHSIKVVLFIVPALTVGCGTHADKTTPPDDSRLALKDGGMGPEESETPAHGSQGGSPQNNRPSESQESSVVEGLGITFELEAVDGVSHKIVNYDGRKQHSIYVPAKGEGSEAWLFVSTEPECQVETSSTLSLKNSVKEYAEAVMTKGMETSGLVPLPSERYAVQKVPFTADNNYILGYYFDFTREFHETSKERLVYLADFLELDRGCIKMKVNMTEPQLLNSDSRAGKIYHSVIETVRFTDPQ